MTTIYKNKINEVVEEKLKTYQDIALDIHAHPEVSNYEFHACEVLSTQLTAEGFTVATDVAGHRTGFAASYKSGKPGPTIAYLAEYDALPGIGHACGHNIYGATSSLAGTALKAVVDALGGEVRVYGTPGEEGGENGSAKGSFVREGFFDDVDVALGIHPGTYQNRLTGPSLANDPVDIEFFGKSSHASGAPEKGINALDAVILTYNGINALREHVPTDVRIHGVITNGGEVANVVPDYASARFYIRAATRETLNDVYAKIEKIVEGAALMTGATHKFGLFQNSVDNTIVTPAFDQVYLKNLRALGSDAVEEDRKAGGSTDFGNVSQVIPTIQPSLIMTTEQYPGHSIEFREAAKSQGGLDSIGLGAKVLAHTAIDLLTDAALLAEIKAKHAEAKANAI